MSATGDRLWSEAGRETTESLADEVGKRAKAIRDQVDVEAVHDMRTATRRLRTAINLYGAEARKKQRDPVENMLRRVARRLGAVRDLDVLLDHLQGDDVEPLREAWQSERQKGARRLEAEIGRQRFDRALRDAPRLARRADGSSGRNGAVERVGTRAPGLIWEAFGKVLAYEIEPATADPAAIHRMRIAAKKLRYTLEAFEEALAGASRLIEQVTELQDAAGEMHDAIVAADRARSTIDLDALTDGQRAAIRAFADAQRRRAEGMRRSVGQKLRSVQGPAFRDALGKVVAEMDRSAKS
jgi:CHAD domain-containing protein